jgi:hypothetical protein
VIRGVNHPARVFLYSLSVHQAILWVVGSGGVLSPRLRPALTPPVYVCLYCLAYVLVLSYHPLLLLVAAGIGHITSLLSIVDNGSGLVGCRVDTELT